MKNVIVVSDLHYDKRNFQKIMPKLAEVDMVIFCGDGYDNFKMQTKNIKTDVVAVKGNCDTPFSSDEKIVEIEGVRVLVTHGHKFGVKSGLFSLCDFCEQNEIDVAFFGHTHDATSEEYKGLKLINPGAISDLFSPSYYFCTFSGGKMFGKHVEVV